MVCTTRWIVSASLVHMHRVNGVVHTALLRVWAGKWTLVLTVDPAPILDPAPIIEEPQERKKMEPSPLFPVASRKTKKTSLASLKTAGGFFFFFCSFFFQVKNNKAWSYKKTKDRSTKKSEG